MFVLKKFDAPFTMVPNKLIEELDLVDLGAFVKMLKKPEDWKFSHHNLMAEFGVGKDKLQAIVRALKAADVLQIKPIHGDGGLIEDWIWIISAVPFNQMPDNQACGTSSRENQQQDNQAINTKKRILQNKNSNQKKKSASRIDPNLKLTDQHKEELAKINPFTDAKRLFEAFKDYWMAESGAKARKLDWMAAWRTWCRKDLEFNQNKGDKNARGYNTSTGAGNAATGAGNGQNGATNGAGEQLNGQDSRIDQLNQRFRANPIIIK